MSLVCINCTCKTSFLYPNCLNIVLQVASSTTPEEAEEEDDADSAPIVPMSPIPAPIPTVSKGRRTSRGTRLRMRANVQGLDEEDSDGDIEIVDFADGELV